MTESELTPISIDPEKKGSGIEALLTCEDTVFDILRDIDAKTGLRLAQQVPFYTNPLRVIYEYTKFLEYVRDRKLLSSEEFEASNAQASQGYMLDPAPVAFIQILRSLENPPIHWGWRKESLPLITKRAVSIDQSSAMFTIASEEDHRIQSVAVIGITKIPGTLNWKLMDQAELHQQFPDEMRFAS